MAPILGFITVFGFARSVGLDNSQAFRVGIIPGILGFNLPSILIAGLVADQEVKSLPPPVPLKAAIEVAPDSHNYGGVKLNSSDCKIFAVSNRGTAELEVTATKLSGNDDSQFTVSDGAPFTVAPGETRNVQVSFTPTFGGEKKASLDIASNDPDRPAVNIGLSGTGLVQAIPDITVAFPLDFGNVPVDSNPRKSFGVSNSGTADLEVTATKLSGTDPVQFFIVSGGAPFTVAPGETKSVVVSFKPASAGGKTANLEIASKDPDRATVNITLSGVGIELTPTPDPESADSDTRASRQSKKP